MGVPSPINDPSMTASRRVTYKSCSQSLRRGRSCRNDGVMRAKTVATSTVALAAFTLLLAPAAAQQPAQSTAQFRNYNRTFQLELPTGWRQIAPGEAVRVGENPEAPSILHLASPRQYYGVGDVDGWLAGDFSSPWLYVIEQRDEWYIGEDYATTLRELWREHGEANGVEHQLQDIHLEKLGTQRVECVVATRITKASPEAAPRISLDVHAPTAKQQITLAFTTTPAAFERWEPDFRSWLSTLTFARVAEEPVTVAQRLWTPLMMGGVVGLILIVLYRHTRARRT